MARKRKEEGGVVGKPTPRTLLTQSLIDSAVKEYGEANIVSMERFFDSIYGLPLTGNLPLQYVTGLSVVPMERVYNLVGTWGTMKSTLAWYFAKIYVDNGGVVVWLDTEHKSNPVIVRLMLGVAKEVADGAVLQQKIKTLDELLGALQKYASWYDEQVPDKDIPLMILVDSLGAVTSEEAVDKMKKDGSAGDVGFGAAHNARNLTEQMRAFVPTHVATKPMTLVMTNHQKGAIDGNRPAHLPPATTEGGGAGKDFAATCTLEMKKMGKDESTKSEDRTRIMIKTKKASLTKTGKSVQVVMITGRDKDTGEDYSFFDWDAALCELLAGDTFERAIVKEIVTIVKANATKYSCSTLGLKDVHPRVIGKAIHDNPEMVTALQNMMRIDCVRYFDYGKK